MDYKNNKKENDDLKQDEELDEEKEEQETVDIDNEELDNALKANKELTESRQRLQAEYLNYKKREEKVKDGLVNYGIETLAVEMLPILDNFERALEVEVDKDNSFFEGTEMIYKGLIEALSKNDIKEMDSLGEPFDPKYHHAVATEDSEEYEKDTIIKILQKGYIMNEKVIRPSMVIVSK